ncbi:hypothetical protein Q5532_05975 [Corynebacterium diphtheriae]|uniref:hypothetical protein n=1 Tax=Corynebacterium diphtheriae TaxID=1717 RepID=UPI00403E26D7
MDGYTLFDVLMDIGWISLLLLIPAPITAGLLGLLLGPNALGIIQLIEHFGDYATILIAAVFVALPFTMDFDAKVRQLAYNVVLFRGHVPSTVGLLRTAWRDSFRLAVQYSGLVRHHTVRRLRQRFRCGSSSWWRTGLGRHERGRGGRAFRNCRWRYLCPLGFKEEAHQRAARLG